MDNPLGGFMEWYQGLPQYAQIGIPVAGAAGVFFIVKAKGGASGSQVTGPYGSSTGGGTAGGPLPNPAGSPPPPVPPFNPPSGGAGGGTGSGPSGGGASGTTPTSTPSSGTTAKAPAGTQSNIIQAAPVKTSRPASHPLPNLSPAQVARARIFNLNVAPDTAYAPSQYASPSYQPTPANETAARQRILNANLPYQSPVSPSYQPTPANAAAARQRIVQANVQPAGRYVPSYYASPSYTPTPQNEQAARNRIIAANIPAPVSRLVTSTRTAIASKPATPVSYRPTPANEAAARQRILQANNVVAPISHPFVSPAALRNTTAAAKVAQHTYDVSRNTTAERQRASAQRRAVLVAASRSAPKPKPKAPTYYKPAARSRKVAD